MRGKTIVVLVAMLGCIPVGAGVSAGQTMDELHQWIMDSSALSFARSKGYDLNGWSQSGYSTDDHSEEKPVQLRAGFEYLYLALCDKDCTDIALSIWDPRNRRYIASELNIGRFNTLGFSVPVSGDYMLSVSMQCTQYIPVRGIRGTCGWALVSTAKVLSSAPPAGNQNNQVPDLVQQLRESIAFRLLRIPGVFDIQENVTTSGSVGQGIMEQRTYPIPGRILVVFLGKCDGNCRDLDLALVDPSGQVVARDDGVLNEPKLSHTVTTPGLHTLRVSMLNCASTACSWAVVVLAPRK